MKTVSVFKHQTNESGSEDAGCSYSAWWVLSS